MTDERRTEKRYEVSIDAAIRNGTGRDREVAITDLSSGGCRLTWPRGSMTRESCLTISAGPVRTLEATVRWVQGNDHGIEFIRPLHASVLDHLRQYLDHHSAWIRVSDEEVDAA